MMQQIWILVILYLVGIVCMNQMLSTWLEIICIRLKNIKAYKAEGNDFQFRAREVSEQEEK